MNLANIYVFAGNPEPWAITVFDNDKGTGKPLFTFCTCKAQIHFSDTFITLVLIRGLLNVNQ